MIDRRRGQAVHGDSRMARIRDQQTGAQSLNAVNYLVEETAFGTQRTGGVTRMRLRSATLAAAVLASCGSCGGDSPTAPTTTPQPPIDAFTLVLRDQAGQQLGKFGNAWPSADPLLVTLYSVRGGAETAVEADWTIEVQDLSSQQAHENSSEVVTLDFPTRPTVARIACSDPCGHHLMRATVTARYQGKSASFSINCRFG